MIIVSKYSAKVCRLAELGIKSVTRRSYSIGVASMAFLLSAACNDAPVDTISSERDDSGGSTSAGNDGAQKEASTQSEANSQKEDEDSKKSRTPSASNQCGVFDSTRENCGTCVQSLDEYCDEPDKCNLTSAPLCKSGPFTQIVEEGCGYLKVSWLGDVGDAGMNIWKLGAGGQDSTASPATGALVYMEDNGMLSSGCGPVTRVGALPSCESWVSACPSNGEGGAGG